MRSKLSEVSAALGACKTSVAEYFGDRAAFPSDEDEAGCTSNTTRYLSSLTVSGTPSAISGTTTSAAGANGCTLTLTAVTSGTPPAITSWDGGSDCKPSHVPATFR
ncbi:MAG: pilin [Burkholderiales bacterium]|nr:pilin [Burkholderiales bacterium]